MNFSKSVPENKEISPGPVVTPESETSRSPRNRLIAFCGFMVLLTAAFSKPLFALVIHAVRSDLDSYTLLVPFVCAYLIYIRRDYLPRNYSSSPGWAMIPLLGGFGGLAAAWIWGGLFSRHAHLTLMALALFCFIVAGGFLFLGQKWMASAAFPVVFLAFIVPMPQRMADLLETASMLASTEAANIFFNLTGTPVLREGTIFQLPNIAIQVGQECSGIRSSFVLLITSLVAANLFLATKWRRAILVAFVIPLGIVRNGFRVWVIGTLCIRFGPQMIHSIIHRRGGPVFFTLSLIPLFLLLWWLRRGEDRREKSEGR